MHLDVRSYTRPLTGTTNSIAKFVFINLQEQIQGAGKRSSQLLRRVLCENKPGAYCNYA